MVFKKLYHWFINLNLFEQNEYLPLLRDQLFATRLFLFLLFISSFILVLFTGLSFQTYNANISSPSLSQFTYLHQHFQTTLLCPCSQPNIHFHQIISFSPQYHQICSSQFISQSFISSLFITNLTRYSALDFRLMAMSQFQVLASLCKISSSTIHDILQQFSSKQFYSNRALSKESFDAEMEAAVEQVKSKTLVDVERSEWFISRILAQNRFMSALNTNTYIVLGDYVGAERYRVGYYPTAENNSGPMHYNVDNTKFCSCLHSCDCIYPAAFYSWMGRPTAASNWYIPLPAPLFTVPGMMVGCFPRQAMFESTLQCFYNRSCLDLIQVSSLFTPLDPSLTSRFTINVTVGTMFAELFLEKWNNESSYTNYYHMCAPRICTYTYEQRQNLIYAVTVLLGIFGGLSLVLRLITPVIVKMIRFLQRKCNGQVAPPSPTNDLSFITRIRQLLTSLLKKIKNLLFSYNMFESTFSSVKLGICATRIYYLLLIITGVILAFYSFFTLQLISVTVEQPTQEQYETLYEEYSSTLVCPCTRLSVTYKEIMTTEPTYHEICSSDFIRDDRWIKYFTFVKQFSTSTRLLFVRADFRTGTGRNVFLMIRTLCTTAQEIVKSTREQFYSDQLISSNAMSKDIFEQKLSASITQFHDEIQTSFNSLLSQLRVAMDGNQLYGSHTVKARVTGSSTSKRVRLVYDASRFPNCSCAITNKCRAPMGFYNRCAQCSEWTMPNDKIVPGFFVGCSILDSLLLSTPECFYNHSCIQMLIEWRDFGLNVAVKPPTSDVTQVLPLNSTRLKRFLPNSTFEDIVSNMFIEEWTSSTYFNHYFDHCQPSQCTYTFSQRYQPLIVITTLIGLMGGLSVILECIVPVFVRLIYSIIKRCSATTITANTCADYFQHLKRKISTLNLFKDQSDNTQNNDHAVLVTRFYLLSLSISLCIIVIFTSLSQQIHSVTVSSPSQQTYQQLYEQYTTTLSCPCTYTLIPHQSFLSITTHFHQVCESDFVSSSWLEYLWGVNLVWSFQDAQLLTSHFQLLKSLCLLSQQWINDATRMLMTTNMISTQVLSSQSFQTQIDSLINTFVSQTPQDFRRLQWFITDTIRSNQIINIAGTTWTLSFTNAKEHYILATNAVSSYNNNCICAASLESCSRSLYISWYSNETSLQGVVGGCLPINGLRLSTLECFYDKNCLQSLAGAFSDRYTYIDYTPQPLNASLQSIYPPTTLFSRIIDELFVEEWINSSNYSSYYSSCSPYSCSYTYVQRNDILYMITTMIGLYGGLTLVLRFVIWHGVRLIRVYIICCISRRLSSRVEVTFIDISP